MPQWSWAPASASALSELVSVGLGWDPDINDGVKVNIEPLQRAGVLRIAEVV